MPTTTRTYFSFFPIFAGANGYPAICQMPKRFASHITRLLLLLSTCAACHTAHAAEGALLQYATDPAARAEADRLMQIVFPEPEDFHKYEVDRRAAVIGNPEAVLSFCHRANFGGYVDQHQLDSVAVCRATISALSDSEESKRADAQASLANVMRKIARSEEATYLLARYDARAQFDVKEPWQIAARRTDENAVLPYFEDGEAKKQAERLMKQFNSSRGPLKVRNMNEVTEMLNRNDLVRRAAEIGMPEAVRRMCLYDPSRHDSDMAKGIAFCQVIQHRIPDSEPDLQQWVQSNLDQAKPYLAEHPIRFYIEPYLFQLHQRWQAREEVAEEDLAVEAQHQKFIRRERQAMVAAIDPAGGVATSTAALTAFVTAVEKRDGKELDKLANPLMFEPPVSERTAAFVSAELARDVLKCRVEPAGQPYQPSEDEIAKGPAQDMVHLYAPVRVQCEKEPQPRMTSVDLVRIKKRWYVDYRRVPK